MEGDDDFGDLYSDVLPPFTTSVQSHPAETDASKSSRSLPIDRHDEEIPYGAPELNNSFPNSNSGLGLKLDASNQDKTLAGIVGGNILGVEAMSLEKGDGAKLPEKGAGGLNFMDDDDDLNIVVEEGEHKADDFVEKDVKFLDKQENAYSLAEGNENVVDHVGAAVAGVGAEQMIPELFGKLENHEWESDESEDDLQIVLNDNRVRIGMERMPEDDDDDGEALVIVADDGEMSHRHQQTEMEEQVLGGQERPPGADAERKELGDAAKTSGGGGIAAPTAVQPKIGYSNHMYNHPFQSQFKYVRPGAAPIPGAASLSLGGTPGQAHPPITLGAVAGRGRGDWQPAGVTGAIPMQKGLQPGYGMPIRGANAAGRGYGRGLDFTLPSHKTIFEVDIDGFEEKPWRVPGKDVSDFFNFGLNEESWKDYCKKLEQLRLETSMQSKIRVYESGRVEQDYDPDLPPELAAAVGIQGIRSENANPGKADAGATDLARGSGRPPVPIGRPIPVETGSSVRFPSMDTRRPRMHDSDAVIEITCQSSADDDDQAEQQENHPAKEDEVDLQQDDADRIHRFSHAYNGQKRELVARREQLKNTVNCEEIGREDNLHVVSEAAAIYQPDRGTGFPNEGSDLRSVKGRGHVKIPKSTASASSGEEHVINVRNESFGYENGKRNPHLSSSLLIGSDGEQAAAVVDDNDVSVTDDRSFDTEREDMALGATSADACEDGKTRTTTKQKRISDVEQVSQENDDKEDSKASRSSENSKARSGSSKDQRKFHDTFRDEVLQDRYHPRTGNSKRSAGDEDDAHRRSRHGRDEIRNHNMAVKEREDSRSRRGGDSNSSLHRHMKSEITEWRKESNTSERSWRRRDEDLHGRRFRVEDSRKREHGGEIGSRNRGTTRESESGKGDKHHPSRYQLDSGSLRGENHDQNTRSRQRNWDDKLKTQNEKVDDLLNKRRKEGAYINLEHAEKEEVNYNQREGSSRRKRERENSSDYQKTDDDAKLNGDDMHNGRQKQEGSLQKERGDRQRDHYEWRRHNKQMHEESLPRREREEKQSVMRSGRPVEDKTGNNHSRRSDDYRRSGREYHSKDVGRHGEQLERIDRSEIDSFPQDKVHEDAYARENQGGSTRENYRRVDRNDIRGVHASNTSRQYERRQSKESESDHGSLISSKKNKDEHIGQTSEKVHLRCITERGSGADDIHANQQTSGKHGEEASADDDLAGSRRGHSKLEHWTSHKERDFGITRISSSSSRKSKDPATHDSSVASSATKVPEEPPDKAEEKQQPSVNKHAGGEINNAYTKVEDKHLDTVKKLNQTENRPNSEIKTERPARKRRWTGN